MGPDFGAVDGDKFAESGSAQVGGRLARFPRCWDLATGKEVTAFVWYLNREREPHPRAVLVEAAGVRVAEVVLPAREGEYPIRDLLATPELYSEAEVIEALRATDRKEDAAERLGCHAKLIPERAADSPAIRAAWEDQWRRRAERWARGQGIRPGSREKRYSEAELLQVLARAESLKEAARLLGVQPATLRRWAADNEEVREATDAAAKRGQRKAAENPVRRWTSVGMAKALRAAGGNMSAAARALGCDRALVSYWAKRSETVRREVGDGRRRR